MILGEFKCQKQKDQDQIYFDAGYFKNRKDYIMKYHTSSGEDRYLYKAKGIPAKYITNDFTLSMIRDFKSKLHEIVGKPYDFKINIGERVQMKVSRRKFDA